MRVLGPAEDDDEGVLFTVSETIDWRIDAEQSAAQEAVGQNLRGLVAARGQVRLVDDPWPVFGDRYGVATESTVRKALRALQRNGEITVVGNAKQLRDFIIAPSGTIRP
jgi:hypothetical protein